MNQTICGRISALRKRDGLTQEELAAQMGVSPQAVSKWENDLSVPDLSVLTALSDYFHLSLDELIRGQRTDVQYVPPEARKSAEELFLRVRVRTGEGDKINVNLPLALVRIAAQLNLDLPQFRGSEWLRQLDLNALLSLIEGGALGKLVEVESSNGDLVEVVVE
ncbi:helix-turn-helix domain-containing protein [Flavonifractor sp. An112]|uniref:helix-turn-helix domain-containing protein n=1 Tax=Flavonifractor sp. An112 TaxID=1965544 RepID=UPI00174C674F|nr:helix-turn-helix transcriptional regulator [Flavonifractor sp. An112]